MILPIILSILGAGAILVIIYLIVGHNNSLKTVEYTFESEKVNKELTLVHLGDLHGTLYGENNRELIERVREQNPDIVLFTGDMLDEEVDFDIDYAFVKELSKLYPIYAVAGNHEEESENRGFERIKALYREVGITLLEDSSTVVEIGGEKINICGVDIPKGNTDPTKKSIDDSMKGIGTDNYTIMLFHRPDPCKDFMGRGIDLMLSGHTHGGHWILPGLINGLYAPEQGLFPKYAGGLYRFDNDLSLVVTRGLSLRSTFIPRAFNPPELVVIKIK